MDKINRPLNLTGYTVKIVTGCGNCYVTVNSVASGEVIEVFATLGRSGSCAHCLLEAVTRCISLGLKYGVPLEEFADQLQGIKCPSPVHMLIPNAASETKPLVVESCPDAISKVLGGKLTRL